MALFKTRLTEALQNIEQEIREEQVKLKEKLIKDCNQFNIDYPVGTIVKYVPNDSKWNVSFGVIVKPAQYIFDDSLRNDAENTSIDIYIARFDYRGYLRPHNWSDTINFYNYNIEKSSLKDVYDFKKQYLAKCVKEYKDNVKDTERRIREYKKHRNKLSSVMSDSIDKFEKETNIEIKDESYGNEFLRKENQQ